MLIGINEEHEIKQIDTITDMSLTQIEVDRIKAFNDWSDTRILCCCYKINGDTISVYPYIDAKLIERLEAEAERNNALKIRVVESEQVIANNSQSQQELLELLIDMEVI